MLGSKRRGKTIGSVGVKDKIGTAPKREFSTGQLL